jgi:hypothetical protein
MSTTAGVGLGEYRSVNGLAVTSLVLGIASWMSRLHPLLYLVPVLGLALGLLALVQIRRSSGTQGGTALAGVGIVLSIALGGWALAGELAEHRRISGYRSEIRDLAEEFGAALAASSYDRAYGLTDVNFQREVTPERFAAVLANEHSRLNGLTGASSNNLARITVVEQGPPTAEAVLLVETGLGEPLRQTVRLVRREEGWRFTEFPAWFPPR